MARTILLVLALVVLILIGLVWTGVIGLQSNADGGVSLTANKVEMTTENRTVAVPVLRTVPGNSQ